jgi:cyclic pyranopterin phosphate synthase
MPEEGVGNLGHGKILSLEDYARLARVAAGAGISKIRLTGGEPLVRKNITRLVECLADIDGIDDIAMTTNGLLFPALAQELQAAGLKRINISLDTLKEERFAYITRRGGVSSVRQAVFKALELGMEPVKINVVAIRGFNDDEIGDFARLAYDYPLHIRFIEFMPVGDLLFWKPERMMNSDEIRMVLQNGYELTPEKTVEGNGPARYYKISGGAGSIGFISPMSHQFCSECNRLRLTADGKLRGCLYEKQEVDLKEALERKASDDELQELFWRAIMSKPAHHNMDSGWGRQNSRKMYQIGG